MPATIFSSASEVKSYGSNLSLNDVTKILSVSGNPASGAGTAAPVGSIALDYSNGKTYKKTGSLATEWAELGSGVGGINYIVNPDAESGTTGWSTYADAAGAQPVDGTGGSPSVTWTRSTTTPLRGTGDFNFVKDAVNRQGQGVSYDVTVDNADLARVLTVSFDYEVLSGTYATGDLAVYLIQDPTGTPVVIQPAGYQVVSATAGTKMTQIATFQTDVAQKSYRLCFHVATTSASAYTLALDNIVLGPTQKVYGAPVTDWKSYTPTIVSGGTTTSNAGNYRQVGDSMNINIITIYSGAGSAAALTYQLPSGFSIDSTKLPSASADQSVVGVCQWYDASTSQERTGSVVYKSATTVALVIDNNGSAVLQGSALGNLDWIRLNFIVPILGWSSNVEVSSSTDTRVVAATYVNSGGKSIPNNTQTTIDTNWIKSTDTHNAFSNGVFTCPVAGNYVVGARFLLNSALNAQGALFNITAVQAGSATNTINIGTYSSLAATAWYVGTSGAGHIFSCQAGDTITIQCYQTLTAGGRTLHTDSAYNSISISRLSGPSAIAASETVAAVFSSAAGNSISHNVITFLDFPTQLVNTHGAVVGAGSGNNTTYTNTWRFVAPIGGLYNVSTTVTILQSSGVTTNLECLSIILKNGNTQVHGSRIVMPTTSGGSPYGSSVSSIVRLSAGDAISIGGYQFNGAGTSRNQEANPSANFVSIVRVGN